MNKNACDNKIVREESYRNVIVDIVGKIKPEYLKRIYRFVSYLYINS